MRREFVRKESTNSMELGEIQRDITLKKIDLGLNLKKIRFKIFDLETLIEF